MLDIGETSDPSLDFRLLGKSTRCNIDHSRFNCIMPQTSTKQPSMKLNYVKHLQKVDSESFIKETEEASMNVVDMSMQHRTVRPLYQESELSR